MQRNYDIILQVIEDRVTAGADGNERMQVVVDALWDHLHDKGVSWVGFYLKVPDQEEMVLGPRRDKPACSPISMHGACGLAFRRNESMVIRDVKELGDGYIACDPRDQSEVVLPIHNDAGQAIGVLDLDSFDVGSFDTVDKAGLERVLRAAGLYYTEA